MTAASPRRRVARLRKVGLFLEKSLITASSASSSGRRKALGRRCGRIPYGTRRACRSAGMRIAVAESRARELLGCGAVIVFSSGERFCATYWFLKPLTKSSGGNWLAGRLRSPRRSRTVLLYWLCVRRRRTICGRVALPPAASSSRYRRRFRQILALELRETVDPGAQGGFFRRSGQNSLTAGMRNAIRRLSEKKRICRVVRIDQEDERSAKSLDAVGWGARLRELQAGGRRHSIANVAAPASGLFENGIDGPRKRSSICGASQQPPKATKPISLTT